MYVPNERLQPVEVHAGVPILQVAPAKCLIYVVQKGYADGRPFYVPYPSVSEARKGAEANVSQP